MPSFSLSSLLSSSSLPDPGPSPYLTFVRLESTPHIKAIDRLGHEVAHFIISRSGSSSSTFTISRVTAATASPALISSAKTSSLSGSTALIVHGQEIKMRQSWEGLRDGKDLATPLGAMKWRTGPGRFEELTDAAGVRIARFKMSSLTGRQEGGLEVLVAADEFVLDLIMTSWVAIVKNKAKENEQVEAASEVIQAVAGT